MKETVQVWARVGAYVEVDTAKFLLDPESALKEGIKKGSIKPSGETYIPEGTIRDELLYRDVDVENVDGVHDSIKEDEAIEVDF